MSETQHPQSEIEPDVVQSDEPEVEPAPEPEPAPLPRVDPVIVGLRLELASKDEQLRSYITAYKQATSDIERERERMARDRERIADQEKMAIAGSLLTVLDNLDRSIGGCAEGEVVVGLRLVRAQFAAVLAELGVEAIPAAGEIFDAGLHEATGLIPASGAQRDQEVIFEEQAGYTFKGKLLRASRVVVASRPD